MVWRNASLDKDKSDGVLESLIDIYKHMSEEIIFHL